MPPKRVTRSVTSVKSASTEKTAPKKTATKRKAPSKKKEEIESSSEEEVETKVEEDSDDDKDEEPEEEAPPKKTTKRTVAKDVKDKTSAKNTFDLTWTQNDTLYVLDSPQIKPSNKIVSFDMDSTLILPKSGKVFPTGRSDWKWLFPEVPEKLRELNKDGYKIVIFTNQAGIEKGKQSAADIKGKIIDIAADLGFPIQAFVAAATDLYRKPNTLMFKILGEKYNGGVKIDKKLSSFVGDAAGRAKGWRKDAKKDFSCDDRSFAHNIGLEFKTPEEFFKKEDAVPFKWECVDPTQVLKDLEGAEKPDSAKLFKDVKGAEVVVLVGRPASGKTTFAKKYFVPKGYVHVNQDTFKTKEKCFKTAREAIDAGKSVIIDNTNGDSTTRAEYLAMAKKKGIPARCFEFTTDIDLCYHLNYFREKVTKGAVRRIPDIAYNMFKSKYSEPSKSEGFSEVNKLSWAPDFDDDEMKQLFLERT